SVHFFSDLARAMETDAELDFMQVSSYHGGKSSTGVVQIRKDLDINIEGRHVVLVEDIVDTGTTLSYLLDLLETRHPKSLRVASLLSKTEARTTEVKIDYLGFDIANEFVVGYGLDYDERYRNLPYVGILRDE
ncbi:hypoxanthine phosphoribosyltransferase, partial [bacterium]